MATRTHSKGYPIRIGMVGVGNWALHGHVRVLDLLPDYELEAIYSQRQEAALDAANVFGFQRVAPTLDALVNDPNVDLVVVLTTAPQHELAVRAAIAAGKNVYCEWPLTVSTAIAQELRDAADMAGVHHVVGLQRRIAPHNRFLADLIAQGYVGRLRSVRMHVSMNYFQALRGKALAWTVPPENFSSVVAIYAGHFLDMLFTAVGWPKDISAIQINQFPLVTIAETGQKIPTTNPDVLVLSGRLADDALVTVHIEGGKRNGSGVQIDITGDEGDLRITNTSAFGDVGDDYHVCGAHGNGLTLERIDIPAMYDAVPESSLPSAVLELAQLYAAYARDVATGSTSAPTFKDAVRMHQLLDAVDVSSYQGVRVEL